MQHRGHEPSLPDGQDLHALEKRALERRVTGLKLAGPLISAVLHRPGLGSQIEPDAPMLDALSMLMARVVDLTQMASDYLRQKSDLNTQFLHYRLALEAVWLVAHHWKIGEETPREDLFQLMVRSIESGNRLLGGMVEREPHPGDNQEERLASWLSVSVSIHTGLLSRAALGHERQRLGDEMMEHLASVLKQTADQAALSESIAVRVLIKEFGNLYLPLWDAETEQIRQMLSGLSREDQVKRAQELTPYQLDDYFARVARCAQLCVETAVAINELLKNDSATETPAPGVGD
ncbi:hypothetical protein [Pseudomonas aeruginosa]|uniref:hypothetical protein n=1 Tax=Pseudomonas aeruginosa TaxID=287 RepID=UPI00287FE108|nr:hypothetical protein [Pseudomonas aeruginosa]